MVNTVFSSLMTMAFASEGDLTSLLQVSAGVRHSRGQRILAAVAKEGSTICVEAVAGDVAPLAGSFIAKMGHEAVEVAAGSVAEQAGSFCVPKPDVLLMQRTFGLNTARDFEAALGAKKRQHTTTTTTVNFHNFNFAEDVKKEIVVKQCPDKKAGLLQTMDATVAHKRGGPSPAQKEREADEKRVCECRSFLKSSVEKMWNEKVFNIVDKKQNAQLLQRNFDAALATKKRPRTTTTTTTSTEQLLVVEGMTTACMKASELEVGVFGAYGMVDSSQLPSWGVVAKLLNDPDIATLFKEANITEGWQHCDQSWVVHGACGKFLPQQKPNNKPNYNDVGYPDMGNEAAIVGDGGLVLRYIDDSWVRQDYGPQCPNCLEKKGDLLGVGFPDEGKGIRAVGRNGLWLKFEPSDDGITGTWEQEVQWVGLSDAEKTTLEGINLHAVQFPDGGDEIMAVGTDGYVLRWLGDKWKLEQVGSGTLKAIAFPDEGDGYGCLVAGSDGEVYMQMGSNDAATWEKQSVPEGPNGEVCDFEDIRYDQDQRIGAGYAIAAGSHGLVYQIKPTENGLDEDLVPIAPTEITLLKQFDFTVYTMQYQGANHIKIAGAGGNIWEFTGGEWTEPAASRKLTRQDIYRSFLSDQGDVITLVGAKGTILRYSSGQFVNAEYEDHGTNLESVAFPDEGGEAIAVGLAGTILEVKNDIWKSVEGNFAGQRHLKCVAFSGSDAMVVGMGGAWLRRRDGEWKGQALRNDDQNLNGCAFGKLPARSSAAGDHFVAVGEGGRIVTQEHPFSRNSGAKHSLTVGTCENDTPCDLNAVAFSDINTKIAVGAGGKIWMQRGNRQDDAWEAVDSPTTKDLYAIAFKPGRTGGAALEEAIIVGAEGTALVYGQPLADKWNLACKGILKGTTCEEKGPWALITEDLKSVTYLDAEKDDDPQKQIAIITGNTGTFVQYGFNAGNRNFLVMKENGSTDKNLNSIAVSNKGALVFVVGQGTDVEGEEPEATIIRKTGKEVWSDENIQGLLQQRQK